MTQLGPAVELLDRALGYTRMALSEVSDGDLARRTPCDRWDLGQLLAHMEDALDAFGEGASGVVDLEAHVPAEVRVATLQQKACALLGAWSAGHRGEVTIGDLSVPAGVVVLAAALEITVHGWDVAQATGARTPLPGDLARALLPVAEALVDDADRGDRFDDPHSIGTDAAADVRLLAFLGREPVDGPAHEAQRREAS